MECQVSPSKVHSRTVLRAFKIYFDKGWDKIVPSDWLYLLRSNGVFLYLHHYHWGRRRHAMLVGRVLSMGAEIVEY